MARYEIEGPDGKRFIIEGPEDATDKEIEAFAESQFSSQPPQFEADTSAGPIERYARGAVGNTLNTMTYGISDKISGLGRMAGRAVKDFVTGEDSDLSAAYHYPQQERLAWQEENPKMGLATAVGGAIANPVNRFIGGQAIQAKTLPGLVKGGGYAGALMSALQSVGETQTPFMPGESFYDNIMRSSGNVAKNAAGSALAGAAIGAAVPVVGHGLKNTIGGIWDQTVNRLPFRQPSFALRKWAEALDRDEVPISALGKKLADTGDDAVLADMGQNSRMLTQSAYSRPGEGKKIIGDYLTGRQEGVRGADKVLRGSQAQRIIGKTDEMIPEDYYVTRKALQNENKAAEFYKQAYSANKMIESAEVDRILKTPSGKQALRKAVQMMRDDMKNVSQVDPELTAALKEIEGASTGAGVGRGLKLETLDYVKRALQDMERKSMDQFGKSTEKSRIVGNLKRKLTKALDAADETGAYAKARSLASDRFANKEALELGTKFMKGSAPGDLKEIMSEMSESELHHFRIGSARQIKEQLAGLVSRADATKKVLDIPALEQKIKMVFGDDRKFAEYVRFLEGEKTMFKTYADVLKGSQTAERMAAMEDAGIDPGALIDLGVGAKTANPGRFLNALVNMTKGAYNRAVLPEGTAREIAKIGTSRSIPPGLSKTFREVLNSDDRYRRALEGVLIGESALIGKR